MQLRGATSPSLEQVNIREGIRDKREKIILPTHTHSVHLNYDLFLIIQKSIKPGTSPGKIVKVDTRPINMSRVGALTLQNGENNLTSATVLGNFLYFGTYTVVRKVLKHV